MKRLLITIAFCASIAGCGGSSATDPTDPAPVSVATPASTAPPATTDGPSPTTAPPTVSATTEPVATAGAPTTTGPGAAAADTTAAAGDGGDVGTRENPVPLGTPAEVGNGWVLTINSVDLDANDVVAAANEYNKPPPDGYVFVLINLTAVYGGEGTDVGSVDVGALGEATDELVDVRSSTVYPVVPEPVLDQFARVSAGGTSEGNIVLEVPTADIDTLVLTGQAFSSFDDADRRFFAAR